MLKTDYKAHAEYTGVYLRSACGLRKEFRPDFALHPFNQRTVNNEQLQLEASFKHYVIPR